MGSTDRRKRRYFSQDVTFPSSDHITLFKISEIVLVKAVELEKYSGNSRTFQQFSTLVLIAQVKF